MSDELLRKLTALEEGCDGMSFGVMGNPRETDFMAADVVREAIAEITKLREERRWIPVGERLPDEDVEVLVWGKGWIKPGTAWRQHVPHYVPPATIWTFGDEIDRGFPPVGITHWMPLPTWPETKEER